MIVAASGYGAGTREFEGAPNVLQVVVGDLQTGAGRGPGWLQELVVVEANVDDVTGEVLGHTIEALMGAGALDAWLVPVVAKKGRPGHVVSFLAEPAKIAALAGCWWRRRARSATGNTTSPGLRSIAKWSRSRCGALPSGSRPAPTGLRPSTKTVRTPPRFLACPLPRWLAWPKGLPGPKCHRPTDSAAPDKFH